MGNTDANGAPMGKRASLLLPAVTAMLAAGMQVGGDAGKSNNVIRGRFPKRTPDKYDVFVSYCKDDEKYWKVIDKHLYHLRIGHVKIYSHDMIEPGKRIHEEVRAALESSVVAVLLLSQNYVSSGLMQSELPGLLQRAESGTLILTVYAESIVPYGLDRIMEYKQVGPGRDKPLNKMKPADRQEVYVKLAEAITDKLIDSNLYALES